MIKHGRLVFLITLVSALMLVFAACGRGSDPEPTAAPEPVAAEEEAAPEEEAAAEEEVADEEVAADEEAAEEEIAEEDVAADEEAATEEEEAAEEEAAPEEEAAAEEETAPEEEAAAEEEMAADEDAAAEEEVAAADEAASDAPSGELAVVSARQVTEIVGERTVPMAAVSGDGAYLFWMQSGDRRRDPPKACIFAFANADKSCVDMPEGFQMYPYQFYWSPDSTQVAFTENPLELGLESDIWVFNVADGSIVNRTDDGVAGSWIANDPGTYSIDYLPMWNNTDGMIYFWRIEPLGDYKYNIGIYRVDATEGEAEVVRDLSDVFTAQLPWFNQATMSMDSVSALSPDGTQVAAIMAAYGDMYSTSQSNLWLVDIANADEEPQWLMSSEDFQAGYAGWQNLPGAPQGLSWMGDGSAVVVDTFSNDTHAPLHVYYYVDVVTGEATPTVDFSEVETLDALFEPTESGIPMRGYSPWTASLSPANDSLLMFNDLGGTAAVMQASYPPTGELPAVLAAAPSPLSGGDTRSSRAVDGKVLMYGVLFTFE